MSVEFKLLYTPEHRLNFNEAIRRLRYWSNEPTCKRGQAAIRILIDMLDRNKGNYHFEAD